MTVVLQPMSKCFFKNFDGTSIHGSCTGMPHWGVHYGRAKLYIALSYIDIYPLYKDDQYFIQSVDHLLVLHKRADYEEASSDATWQISERLGRFWKQEGEKENEK